MRRELVERIVEQAWQRGFDQRRAAGRIDDFGVRCERMAVLWERQARWWAVLSRHVDPMLYRRAVCGAQVLCEDRAGRYREYAASAAERTQRAALRAAERAA